MLVNKFNDIFRLHTDEELFSSKETPNKRMKAKENSLHYFHK